MHNTEYNPIQPVSFLREVQPFELETETLLVEELDYLQDILGISMQNFTTAASHVAVEVGDFIDGVISGISRFTNHAMSSVSRETYQTLEVEDDFSLFMESSLNQPMGALERIHHTVNDIHGLIGFGVGKGGAVFLQAFERVLASDIYTRLERAVRGHGENMGLGVRDMYVLLSSDVIDDSEDFYLTGFSCARQMIQWFFGKTDFQDPDKFKKNPFKPVHKLKQNSAFAFYVKKKKTDITQNAVDIFFKPQDMNCYPNRYTYISISESVLFVEINRLFKDFYINRNIFEHRVNEFLTDIAILVATYTMFIRQATMIGDLSDTETDLTVSLERLCLSAETLKSISHDKDSLKILGLSKFDHGKDVSKTEDIMTSIREAVCNCQSIAATILSQQDIWDLLPMVDENAVILETGKSDVVNTLEKLNTILYHIDELKEISSALDIHHISFALKQFQYKLKLSGI